MVLRNGGESRLWATRENEGIREEAQSIWCFLHRQQSDKHELQFGIDIAKRVVREVAEGDNPVVNSLLHGLHGMLDLHKMNDIYEFYFFSFSRHRDDREQWKVYGRKGSGYSIGFAPELFQPNQSKLLPQANQNVFVGKVLYGRDATRDRHRRTIRRLAGIVDRTSRAHPLLVCGKLGHAWFDAMNRAALTQQIIWNCLTANAASFKDEQETRYILLNEAAAFDPFRKNFRDRNYIETPLLLTERGNLTEIIVGPDAPAGAEDIARALLRDNGYPDGIPISRSRASSQSAVKHPL